VSAVTLRPPAAREEALIRELRAKFNTAIAAHDRKRISDCWAPNIHVSTSDGTPLLGRAAVQQAFEQFFANADFITFVREPARIDLSADGLCAAELGSWTGRWRAAPPMHGVRAPWNHGPAPRSPALLRGPMRLSRQAPLSNRSLRA
jgi:ketosteroid isomerase-like protein